jgi:hypothetical protein
MKKIISIFIVVSFSLLASHLHAGWTFDNGSFKMTGDTTIYVVPEDSSLYLHKFGYFVNDDPKFYKIDKSNINQALNFKDGDTVRFAKKGLLYYYAEETSQAGVYNINSDDYGFTMPFSFTVGTNKIAPSGQPLPAVLFTAVLGAFCIGGGYLFSRKKSNKA